MAASDHLSGGQFSGRRTGKYIGIPEHVNPREYEGADLGAVYLPGATMGYGGAEHGEFKADTLVRMYSAKAHDEKWASPGDPPTPPHHVYADAVAFAPGESEGFDMDYSAGVGPAPMEEVQAHLKKHGYEWHMQPPH